MQIERIQKAESKNRYRIIGSGRNAGVVAEVDTIEKAGCLMRFLHGSNLRMDEYDLAVKTLREIDAREA